MRSPMLAALFCAVMVPAAFCAAAGAALYDKGDPVFLPAPKTPKDDLEMLKGFELVLKDEPQIEGRVVARHGFKVLLQSPQYSYPQGKDFFLFFRFRAMDGQHPMRLNLAGSSFKLEMIDMTRAKIDDASYAYDKDFKTRLAQFQTEAINVGSTEDSVPEVLFIFNLGDFDLVPPSPGTYRIKLIYTSESKDNRVWTGALESNPILVEVV